MACRKKSGRRCAAPIVVSHAKDPAQHGRTGRWYMEHNRQFLEFDGDLMGDWMGFHMIYPLVNFHITMENHHFSWVNPRTKSFR